MSSNTKIIEKEPCFFRTKKDDFSRISINSNDMSTHSEVKEAKCNIKIFKIQKYVKSGKFENKILSEDEFSGEEILYHGELNKKISPYSKVNFSKLRNKEKKQRYLMMRKLVKNLNLKLKSLEKQVSKNPCSLLDKLAKIKISKMEKLSNKSKKDSSLNIEDSEEFKFENLVKAAKKLYFYEDFEFGDEKNLLNLLFRLLDNEKINLNSFHFNKIMNIIRTIRKINSEKNISFTERMKLGGSDEKMHSNHISDNLDLALNELNTEEEDYPLMNLKFKVIEDENLKHRIQEAEPFQIQITQKDLNIIENCQEQNDILKIIFNLDDKKNFHFNQKSNIFERCELKLKNNFNTCKNKNKKIKSIGIKSKTLKIQKFNKKNEDFICPSNRKNKKNNYIEELDKKLIENDNNEKSTSINERDEYLNHNNEYKNKFQTSEIKEPYHLVTSNSGATHAFDFRYHLLNILNENILKISEDTYQSPYNPSCQVNIKPDLFEDNSFNLLNHSIFKKKFINCSDNSNYNNFETHYSKNTDIYSFFPINNNLIDFYIKDNNHLEHSQNNFINKNCDNIFLNNKTGREKENFDSNNTNSFYPSIQNLNYNKNNSKIERNFNYEKDDYNKNSDENLKNLYKAYFQLATQNLTNIDYNPYYFKQ